jgi:hypothetical protein
MYLVRLVNFTPFGPVLHDQDQGPHPRIKAGIICQEARVPEREKIIDTYVTRDVAARTLSDPIVHAASQTGREYVDGSVNFTIGTRADASSTTFDIPSIRELNQ